MCSLHLSLPHYVRWEAAVRQLIEELGHTDNETVGSPTKLDNQNGESAREEIPQHSQEGVKPETRSAT